MVDAFLVQQHAIARQEHPLPRCIALEYEIPLPGREQCGVSAVDADPDFCERHRLIGAPVGWPLQAALKLQPRYRLAVIVPRLDLQCRTTIRGTLDMRGDLPIALVLL